MRINGDHETVTMQHPPLSHLKRETEGSFSTDKSSPAPPSSLASHCLRVVNGDHEMVAMQHPPLPHLKRETEGSFSTDESSPAPPSSLTSHCSQVDLFSCF
jgi:hypothetical protein